MNKKTKIIILISLCILIAIIGIYFLFPKGSNTQNIYVQKVSTIIGSSYTENRYSGVVESSETVDINLMEINPLLKCMLKLVKK